MDLLCQGHKESFRYEAMAVNRRGKLQENISILAGISLPYKYSRSQDVGSPLHTPSGLDPSPPHVLNIDPDIPYPALQEKVASV